MTRLPCPLCRRRLPQDAGACEPCRAHLARQLADVAALIGVVWRASDREDSELDPVTDALPAGPVPAVASGPMPRHAALSHSPAPRVSRGASEATIPDSVQWLQHSWGGSPDLLAAVLDQICDDPTDVVQFANDLRTAWTDLRRAAGYTLTAIGYCPTEGCGTELLADQHDDAVVCDGCGTVWTREHWRWLTDTLRAA